MNKDRLVTLCLIIFVAAASRLLPHPVNVTPIAAIALFAGAQFGRGWMAFALPALALLISDAIIGFYAGMWVTYLGFAAIVCIGFALSGKIKPLHVAGASVAGSLAFFLVTNFALWAPHDLYPKSLDGIVQSYVAGLPFLKNSLLGDLFYNALIFGGFALAERKYARLKAAPAPQG